MDLNQRKLTRDEWNSIEVPISSDEKRILKLIQDGYGDVMIKRNTTPSMLQHLKVDDNDAIDMYVFTRYIQDPMIKAIKQAKSSPVPFIKEKHDPSSVKKKDLFRFGNTDSQIEQVKSSVFEFVLLDILKQTLKSREKNNSAWVVGFFTLTKLLGYSVSACNRTLCSKIDSILTLLADETQIKNIVYGAAELIEHNPYLLKYADEELYDHQRRIFTQFKRANGTPQLVLYIAPTGTGKTCTPIGLAEGYKVIFVCAARHVGLALAKSSISSGRKVAFAFGCSSADDIRLHYGAAVDFTRDRRSGSIRKVDNSKGEKVEIIISDIKSYIPAMHYMCAFNKKKDIITYWDEPTITLDYDTHPIHEIIKQNWEQNIIPNMVLSSATLPQEEELSPTIRDWCSRFADSDVTSIVSFDCKKTIPLVNKAGFVEMPHFLYDTYEAVKTCADYCKTNKTLLRYIDLEQSVTFIEAVNEKFPDSITSRYSLERQFPEISDVDMLTVKIYYLELISNINPEYWQRIIEYVKTGRNRRHASNVRVSTHDSHTLTDGPTIFLADDVDKIGKFCLQQAKIPETVLADISDAIQFNGAVNEKISVYSKKLEDLTAKDEESGNDKKLSDLNRGSPEVKDLRRKIDELRKCIRTVALPDEFVPNMTAHQRKYASDCKNPDQVFKPNINEDDVENIMLIDDIGNYWKLLLMMGIGVFAGHDSDRYTEIMKKMAQEQKLYLIIASTDFIYGTNYQFCHGYLSTDLVSMSQEKAIQAMGRVGRNKLQFDYTIRFRNDEILKKLFEHDASKPEVRNMEVLFNS